MLKEMSYEEILNVKNYVLIDLRTEMEYEESSIPSAINLPILSNEERREIGTIYKNVSTEEAKTLALKYVGPRLHLMYEEIKKLAKGRMIVMFCARGGLRSRVLAYTLSAFGLPIIRMDSGYKGYRNYILKNTAEVLDKISFITLFGKTGSGKTDILSELNKMGADVLDLEGCANHRGSIMGSIGKEKIFSQKQFENNVFDMLINRKSDIIFTEGESKRIGSIIMGNELYEKTRAGKNIFIECPLEIRIQNIKKEYLNGENIDKQIVEALSKLERYISKKDIEELKNNILQKDYDIVIEKLMLNYYDLNYKSVNSDFEYRYNNLCAAETAKNIFDDFL